MYTVNIQPDNSIDVLIEGYLKSHPENSVEDALESIFQAGVRSLLIFNLEQALTARKAEKQPC